MNSGENWFIIALLLLGAAALLPGLIMAAPFLALALWLLGRPERD
jgi:hypothetical protein